MFHASSLLQALFCSTLLFIIMLFFFQLGRLIRYGFRSILALSVLAVIRICLPFESPFSFNIYMNETLSGYFEWVQIDHISLFENSYSIFFDFFFWFWMIGVILFLFMILALYAYIFYIVQNTGTNVTFNKPYASLLSEICGKLEISNHFSIIEIPNLPGPMAFSIRKHIILLPKEHSYTQEELFFILQHEIGHHIHRDLAKKAILTFANAFYWWNPFFYLLRNSISDTIEMNIDWYLTKYNSDTTIRYLSCLLQVRKKYAAKAVSFNSQKWKFTTFSLFNTRESALEKRFRLLRATSSTEESCSSLSVLSVKRSWLPITIGVILFLISYQINICPYITVNQNESGNPVFQMTAENAYAVQLENGTYELYWNGQRIETLNSLESYSSSIPIYQSKEDIP